MASGPITSWQIDGETMKTVTDFIFLGSKITADGDCSHKTKRCLLLGIKTLTNIVYDKAETLICQQSSLWSKLWRRKWQPTPMFLPGKSHGWRSPVGYTVHGVTKSWTQLSD